MAASIVLILLLATQPADIDCSKVRWYARYMSETKMTSLARKWGYSEADIEKGKRCLKR
jgi:hypothetical protein